MARPMLADGRGHDIVPASEEELLDELRRFDNEFRAAREPRIVTIYADPEADVTPKLWIGLGRRTDDATVAYQHGLSGAQSRGPRRNDKREIGYEYGDGYSEFHRSTLVPKEDALAAAREFFDVDVADLTLAQAALLAGLPPAPNRFDPRRSSRQAFGRQRYVL